MLLSAQVLEEAQRCKLSGDLRTAISTYRCVIGLEPTLTQAHVELGTILLTLDREAEARPYLETACVLAPRFAPALRALAELSLRQGDRSRAEHYSDKAQEIEAAEAAIDPGVSLAGFEARTGDGGPRLVEALRRLVCPECRGALRLAHDRLVCSTCQPPRRYEVVQGEIPVFYLPDRNGANDLEAIAPAAGEAGAQVAPGKPGLGRRAAQGAAALWRATSSRCKKALSPPIWYAILLALAWRSRGIRSRPDETLDRFIALSRETRGNSIFNIYLKTLEAYYFARHPPNGISMEFGGNWGNMTISVYGGEHRITYSSEYFIDVLLDQGRLPDRRHEVFDCLFVSTALKFPLPDECLDTVLSMHILDHVVEIEEAFSEIGRVLRPGGVFHASTYGREIWLPEFGVLARLGLLSERYRAWRLRRRNPRGGDAYQREGSYPTGQNLLDLREWGALAARHGLVLEKVIPFTHKRLFALLVDTEYQGFYCPASLVDRICAKIRLIVQDEVREPPTYSNAFNAFFVFRKPREGGPS